MGISDIYLGIAQKRNISHFANIVRIAKSDRDISVEEIEFLSRISHKYNITDEQFKDILKDPGTIPTLGHIECEERIERLYELMQMIDADHKIQQAEIKMLERIVIGLAFPLNTVDEIVKISIETDPEVTSLEEFTEEVFTLVQSKL